MPEGLSGPFEPPYYVVVFTSRLTASPDGYGEAAARMLELARQQPGFLGIDSARVDGGVGITVSYWRDEESIAGWRNNAEHTATREHGRKHWYEGFVNHVARVERVYDFSRPDDGRAD